MELYRRSKERPGGMLVMGLVVYVAGLAVSALAGWGLRLSAEAVVPRTARPKRGGRGRKAHRG